MNFESTGAVVAALTTSIPEHPATTRIWDYRLSWIHGADLPCFCLVCCESSFCQIHFTSIAPFTLSMILPPFSAKLNFFQGTFMDLVSFFFTFQFFVVSLLIKVRERLDVLAEDEKSRYQTVHLQPVYSIQHESVLKERTIRSLPGYMSFGLVRIGNSAYLQTGIGLRLLPSRIFPITFQRKRCLRIDYFGIGASNC